MAQAPSAVGMAQAAPPPTSVAPQASTPYQGSSPNAWQQAFNSLTQALSTPIWGSSQSQAYLPSTNPMNGGVAASYPTVSPYPVNNLGYQQTPTYAGYPPTSQLNPAYYSSYSQPSQTSQKKRLDGYPESAEVNEYWDLDELNAYACELEDKYINARQVVEALYAQLAESNAVLQGVQEQVLPHYQEVAEKYDLQRELLLDPDMLARWTLTMLGDGGIYGDETPTEPQQQYYVERAGFPDVMPQAGYEPSAGWDMFERAFELNPTVAYQYLDAIPAYEVAQRPMVGT